MKNFLKKFSRNKYDNSTNFLFLAHVIFVILVIWFFIYKTTTKWLAVSDFSPFSGSFSTTFNKFLYVWDNSFTGQYDPSNYLHLVRSFFEILSSPTLAQSVFIIFFFALGYFGMYFLLKHFNYHKYVCIIVPFFFLFNPAFATELINGYTGYIIIYMMIPLLFLSVCHLLKGYSLKWGLTLSFIIAIFLLNPQIGFWIVADLILFILLFIFLHFKKETLERVLLIALHGIGGILFNMISLITLFNFSSNYSNVSYLSTFKYTYADTYLFNVFRMIGNHGSKQADLGYYGVTVGSVLFFVFIILILYFYIKKIKIISNKNEKIFIIFSLTSLLSIAGFFVLIRMGNFDSLIESKNLLIVSLRSPIKLFIVYAFNFVSLIAFAVNYLIIDLSKLKKYSKPVTFFSLGLLILIYGIFNSHFFDRDFGLSRVTKDDAYFISEKYQKLFKEIEILDNKDEGYFLHLPFDYPIQLKLTWQDKIVKQKMGGEISQSANNDFFTETYKNICDNNISSLIKNNLNIKYIILDKDPITYHSHVSQDCTNIEFYGTPYVWGNYEYFEKIFNNHEVVFEDENYKIFKINKNIQPEIYSFTSLYNFDFKGNLSLKQALLDNISDKEARFTSLSENVIKSFSTSVFNVFNETSEYKSDHFTSSFKVDDSPISLYKNYGYKNLFYSTLNNVLKILAYPEKTLYFNGKLVNYNNEKINSLTRINLNPTLLYWYKISGRIFPIKLNTDSLKIGTTKDEVDIFSTINNNLIPNGSFENGLWREKVNDCNASDDDPIIEMKISDVASNGNKSLELDANNHIACTYVNNIFVKPGTSYLLSFDYQSPNGLKMGYNINFVGSNEDEINEKVNIVNNKWNNFSKIIYVPKDSESISLTLYSYSGEDENSKIITRYDNFQLLPYKYISTVESVYNPKFISMKLKNTDSLNEARFEYRNPDQDFSNHILNPSFEDGLWKNKVEDCNKYDDNSSLMMEKSNIAIDGNYSLSLSAIRHTACTNQTFNIKGNTSYSFNFKYQSFDAEQAGFYIIWNDELDTVLSERINIKNSDWQTYTKQIITPENATSGTLYLYSYEKDGKKKITTKYDDFHLEEIPDIRDRYFFTASTEKNFEKPIAINYVVANPSKKFVKIEKATTPFYLAMNKTYHTGWKVFIKNKKYDGFFDSWIPFSNPDQVSTDKHFELDEFLNGWFIDTDYICKEKKLCQQNEDGTYNLDLVIEFWPQRWFYLGLVVSGATILGCFGYLIYDWQKRRKIKTNTHPHENI